VGNCSSVAQLTIGPRSVCGSGREQCVHAGRGVGDAVGIIEVAIDDLGASGAQPAAADEVGSRVIARTVAAVEQDVDDDAEAASRTGDQNALVSHCISSLRG
jgi:hypothetical protein